MKARLLGGFALVATLLCASTWLAGAQNELAPGKKTPALNWKHYLFFALLANLPDIDVLIGLLFHGNANIFHRGMTHSLLFSFFAAFAAAIMESIPN